MTYVFSFSTFYLFFHQFFIAWFTFIFYPPLLCIFSKPNPVSLDLCIYIQVLTEISHISSLPGFTCTILLPIGFYLCFGKLSLCCCKLSISYLLPFKLSDRRWSSLARTAVWRRGPLRNSDTFNLK